MTVSSILLLSISYCCATVLVALVVDYVCVPATVYCIVLFLLHFVGHCFAILLFLLLLPFVVDCFAILLFCGCYLLLLTALLYYCASHAV